MATTRRRRWQRDTRLDGRQDAAVPATQRVAQTRVPTEALDEVRVARERRRAGGLLRVRGQNVVLVPHGGTPLAQRRTDAKVAGALRSTRHASIKRSGSLRRKSSLGSTRRSNRAT